jgi:hypothetical protein
MRGEVGGSIQNPHPTKSASAAPIGILRHPSNNEAANVTYSVVDTARDTCSRTKIRAI